MKLNFGRMQIKMPLLLVMATKKRSFKFLQFRERKNKGNNSNSPSFWMKLLPHWQKSWINTMIEPTMMNFRSKKQLQN